MEKGRERRRVGRKRSGMNGEKNGKGKEERGKGEKWRRKGERNTVLKNSGIRTSITVSLCLFCR